MIVLAIETATAVCGAALIDRGKVLSEQALEAPQIHSEKILGLIDGVLKSSNMLMENVKGVCVSIGPGSFTGLRIGLSVAKGLCFADDKPLIGISTLESLAWNALRRGFGAADQLVLSAIDARRDEVYVAGYRARGLEEVIAPCAVRLPELIDLLDGEQKIILVGDGAEKIHKFLMNDRNSNRFVLPSRGQRLCSASAIGILGEGRLEKGERSAVATLEPAYVKEFYTPMNPHSTAQR